MTGPLQAMYREQQTQSIKIKERGHAMVSEAQERRNAQRASWSNMNPTSCMEEASVAAESPRLQLLLRHTATSQKRKTVLEPDRTAAAGLRGEPAKTEKPTELQDTEEEQTRWERFLHKNSIFQEKREKYLDGLRRRKEEKEVAECTFAPPSRATKNRAQVCGTSMFDRNRAMEAKKQERIQRMRQELVDREMAQCSFQPTILSACDTQEARAYSGSHRPSYNGTAHVQRSNSVCSRPSCDLTFASRPSYERCYSAIHLPSCDFEGCADEPANLQAAASQPCSRSASQPHLFSQALANRLSTHQREPSTDEAGTDSEGSEYWEGANNLCDEQLSLGSLAQLGDVTALFVHESSSEPTLVAEVSHCQGNSANAHAYNDRALLESDRANIHSNEHEQCNSLQKAQSAQCSSEDRVLMRRSSGANAFAAALRQRSSFSSTDQKPPLPPSSKAMAVVAMAH